MNKSITGVSIHIPNLCSSLVLQFYIFSFPYTLLLCGDSNLYQNESARLGLDFAGALAELGKKTFQLKWSNFQILL